MNQIQREKVIAKLAKIKALAERGEGGEKVTALQMYEALKDKYSISDEEVQQAAAVCEVQEKGGTVCVPMAEYSAEGAGAGYRFFQCVLAEELVVSACVRRVAADSPPA